MAEPFVPIAREEGPASLLNAVFVGYMIGTYSVMGKGGAQAISNMAGEYVGQEILAYAKSQGKALDTTDALGEFLKVNHLVGEIAMVEGPTEVTAQISKCGICPKRIGKYQFDGTACPWGGILIGALEPILKRRFSVSARLTPAATCTIVLKYK